MRRRGSSHNNLCYQIVEFSWNNQLEKLFEYLNCEWAIVQTK